MSIRTLKPADTDGVVRLSLRAWAPVFAAMQNELDGPVYRHFFPDWEQEQRNSVAAVCADPEAKIWVCEIDGKIAGFVAVYQRAATYAEIYMIAVDPDFQGQSVGKRLTEHALGWMRENGIGVAMVETGGDSGHAPARQLYERSGFQPWPVARYFQYLG
jgi:ribosomal protein S18 acetylase RimI-like enzyme